MSESTLSPVRTPGAIACPGCDLYTTRPTTTSALRQLTCHIRGAHPAIYREGRFCNGPSHDRVVWLPLAAFNRRGRRGSGTRECKVCERRLRERRLGVANSGYVPVAAVVPIARELHERLGGAGAARAAGVSTGCFYNILREQNARVQRGVAARLLVTLRTTRQAVPA